MFEILYWGRVKEIYVKSDVGTINDSEGPFYSFRWRSIGRASARNDLIPNMVYTIQEVTSSNTPSLTNHYNNVVQVPIVLAYFYVE